MRNLPTVRTPAQKTNRQTPMMTPATVKLPMRHEFGVRDRHTLSVVNEHWEEITGDHHNDHQQRSQDRLTCHDRPTIRNSTVTILLSRPWTIRSRLIFEAPPRIVKLFRLQESGRCW
jgi:hypothetical protein